MQCFQPNLIKYIIYLFKKVHDEINEIVFCIKVYFNIGIAEGKNISWLNYLIFVAKKPKKVNKHN